MSLTELARGEVPARSSQRRGHGAEALTAGVRALFAAVSGILLTAGIGVVLWAVTPNSASGPQQSLRAGIAAFAAGNAMTLSIGRAALTLPPLMITVVAVGLLAGIRGRGRTDDRMAEVTFTAAAAAVYAAVVTVAGVALGTPGAVAGEQWWRPFLLAAVVVGTTVFVRGEAWRGVVLVRTPPWFPVAVRLGAAGAVGVLAAGAAAVVIGLAGSFGSADTVQTLAAPGPAAGFGMALLNIAYLPNAVVAGAGYVTGVGFHVGAGSYSPFGSSPVELPAVSLLAAIPDGHEASRVGMVLLLVPVVVALLIGRAAVRRLGSRSERLSAVGTAAAVAGVMVAVLAVLAGGGITGGQWATSGAPPLLLGLATALIVGVFGAVVAGLARPSAVQPSAGSTAVAAAPDGTDLDDSGSVDVEAGTADTADADADATVDTATDTAEAASTDADADVEELPTAAQAGPGQAAASTEPETAAAGTEPAEASTEPAAAAASTEPERAAASTEPETAAASTEAATAAASTEAATVGSPEAGTAATGRDTVPQARSEEDALAARPVRSTDTDLDAPSRSEPGRVG